MNTSTNNQPGDIGVGWTLNVASIQRHLKTCNLTQAPDDKCLDGDKYSITLNGRASTLVEVSGNLYRLQSDPMWKVEKLTDTSNADAQNEYWRVTTPDGTQYYFGHDASRNSVAWVTVYSPSSNGECGSFTYRLCDKAYEWFLDRIVDTSGNEVHFTYLLETNWYRARNLSSTYKRQYVRAAHLQKIEYTMRGTDTQPTARVLFNYEMRCGNASSTYGQCTWPSSFPDTPGDLLCTTLDTSCSEAGPTFWSQYRLGSISRPKS